MDLELAIKDSLLRQISEAKRQLKSLSKQSLQKELELSRKLEEAKAKILINFCKFKKEVQDIKSKVQDFHSECKFDFQNREQLILHSNTELIKWKYSRIQIFEEISELLKSNLPFRSQLALDDFNEEETTARIIEELQIENLDLIQTTAHNLYNLARVESIRREILSYLRNLVQGNNSDCFEQAKLDLTEKNRDSASGTWNGRRENRVVEKFDPSESLASLASLASFTSLNSLASSQSLSSEHAEDLQGFRDLKDGKISCCDKIFKCFRKKR